MEPGPMVGAWLAGEKARLAEGPGKLEGSMVPKQGADGRTNGLSCAHRQEASALYWGQA